MKNLLSKIWFPLALVSTVAATQGISFRGVDDVSVPGRTVIAAADTVIYPIDGYKRGWTLEEFGGTVTIADSLLNVEGEEFGLEVEEEFTDSIAVAASPAAEDTLFASIDSALVLALDSLWIADSLLIDQNIFDHWYAGLSDKERKKYDREMMIPIIQARKDSIKQAKEFDKAYKDSVMQATPRVLSTYFLPDSMQYKRMVTWTHDRNFHNLTTMDSDKSADFNYRFNDYPFLRNDVNGVWLGVAGSPVLTNNFFKRKSQEGVMFYDATEAWSYSPQTLPMYNTKTPYTELSYSGTLFESEQTASHNIHILTTQNVTPGLNLTFLYERFGGEGMLSNERTANRNLYAYANYVGEKYMLHTGFISNYVSRKENGGAVLPEPGKPDPVRDTTMDARNIPVYLKDASSTITKKTFFLDQQYRIPLTFLLDLFKKKDAEVAEEALTTDLNAEAQEDSVVVAPVDVTTAFVGHSSEFTRIGRLYEDKISDAVGRNYYNNAFYNYPGQSRDSLGVTKFDNKLFIRLQPWAKEALVSKLDVGVGENIMKYATFDRTYLYTPKPALWTSTYLYAGAEGGLGDYFDWNAVGHYSLLGDEAGDFDISGNATFRFYPFRKARTSPVNIILNAETSLDEPQYYYQHMSANHFRWENSFSKISTTKASGRVNIPHWSLDASVNYALLVNNIYFDATGMIAQNLDPMSVLSVTFEKSFAWKIFHMDNRWLVQFSSNQNVVPLPMIATNGRYFMEFNINHDALRLQVGANLFMYSKYKLPRWNPNVGVFYNQDEREYGSAPYFDVFANMKWQDVCIFVKLENAGMGWPLKTADYYSSDRYIRTPRMVKIGVFWPFHPKPAKGAIDPGPNAKPSNTSSSGSSRNTSSDNSFRDQPRGGNNNNSGGLGGARFQRNR